jgi:hypothetical protein
VWASLSSFRDEMEQMMQRWLGSLKCHAREWIRPSYSTFDTAFTSIRVRIVEFGVEIAPRFERKLGVIDSSAALLMRL